MSNITGAWQTDLANMMKTKKEHHIGATVGRVVDKSPLSIAIMDGDIIIQSDVHRIFVDDSLGRILPELQVGDNVFVIPDDSQQVFFVLNKLKKVGG